MKRRMIYLLLAACVLCTAIGCGKKKEAEPEPEPEPVVEEEEPEPEPEPKPEPEPEDTHEGMAKSYLTGEWIDEEQAKKRPLAIMIGNTSDALPQYGISSADVIYEVPVEGSYTRLMAIFGDYSGLEKIGSVRSCRHYFIYFAKEFDAIYAHYGQAIYAEPILARDDVHNLSPGYFVNKPWFVYNSEDGLYYRYEFKDKQIDGATEAQLAVKNILIQYCDWSYKDENGYMDIDTLSGGEGYYITNGKMEKVTWTKDNEDSPARYFDESGNEITINQGKTWVCVARNKYKDRFGVYATEEELSEARATEQ